MEISAVLRDVGLSPGEAKVYLALLKLGAVPVHKIKEETGLHRTTIFDFLEKLLKKGLAGFVVKNNVNYYNAAHPDKLLAFVHEKEENVGEVLPRLLEVMKKREEGLNVEVYQGEEGFKTLLNDILRTKKDFVAFGIDENKFKGMFPILMEQYFKKEEKAGIKERLLTSEEAGFVYKKKNISYRYIPGEYFSPTPTLAYGNKTASIIWEPFTIILIESRQLAESYKKHFELLWSIEGKKPIIPRT